MLKRRNLVVRISWYFALIILVINVSNCQKPSFVDERETPKNLDAVGEKTSEETSDVGVLVNKNPTGNGQNQTNNNTNSDTDTDTHGTVDPHGLTLTYDETFPVGTISEQTITFNPGEHKSTQEISMVKNAPRELTLKQGIRPRHTETFHQGHDGLSHNESFQIQEGKMLDILIVVDDSSSMTEKQLKVANRLSSLTSHLQNIDWQITIVTTTSSCFQQGRIFKPTDANVNAEFKTVMENVGADGFDVEMGIKNAVKGLKGECGSANPTRWLRANSTVAVLIVADEDNCGIYESSFSSATKAIWDHCLVDPEGGSSTYLTDYLKSIRPAADGGRVYGIYWDPNNASCDAGGSFGQKATKYAKAVTDTSGMGGCVYASDYTNILTAISNDASQIVHTQFALAEVPDSGTISVKIDGQVVAPANYQITGKILKLINFTQGSQTVIISYTSGATPKTPLYLLTWTPLQNSVYVTMKDKNGQTTDPGTFTVQTAPSAVLFDILPPDSAEIKINYIENQPLPTEFSLGAIDIEGAPLSITVNGNVTADYTYDQNQKKVVFNIAPAESATIVVSYITPNDKVTEYHAVPNASHAAAITAVDLVTGQSIEVNLIGEYLVFKKDDVEEGRRVVVTYDFGTEHDFVYLLPADPLPNTVAITVENEGNDIGTCENISVLGRLVSFECPGQPLPQIKIYFQYVAIEHREFTFEIPDPEVAAKITPEILAQAEWRVYIDETEISVFTVQGLTVTLDEDVSLDANSLVKITLKVKIN